MEPLLLYHQDIREIYRDPGIFAKVKRGIFRLKTFTEAESLTAIIAESCPEPDRIALGLFELLANGIEHGNLGISHEEKWCLMKQDRYRQEINHRLAAPSYRDRYVEIAFDRQQKQIAFRIEDQGAGFDYNAFLNGDLSANDSCHGRGIALARSYSFDHMNYSGTGNKVLAITKFP
ncbi:MAG: ATP-binding protein [Alphaproteobacteria bacterium]|nr:ATP-binding protein [Alphaproteobacteria bacterium]